MPSVRSFTEEALHRVAASRAAGYVEEVLRSAAKIEDGKIWLPTGDFVRIRKKYGPQIAKPAKPESPGYGPGTELKALLKRVGIVASPGCSCNTRAKLMDANELKEPGWCEKNLETICDWLQEEATKRKLPFVRMAAKILVRQAIRNARKKGQ
jgi:hypothetical protein